MDCKIKLVDRCHYKGCVKMRGEPGVQLFNFPVKKHPDYETWCVNAGIEEGKRSTRLKLCGDHFRSSDFSSPACDKLLRRKVPIHFDQADDAIMPVFQPQNAVRNYGQVNTINLPPSPPQVPRKEDEEITSVDEEDVDPDKLYQDRILALEAESQRLRDMVQTMENQLHKQSLKSATVKEEEKKEEEENEFDVEKFLDERNVKDEARRAMIKLQLRPSKKTTLKFSEEEMKLSIKLHFYSASGYNKMKDDGLILPHSRTIEKRVARISVSPGFQKPVLENLKNQLKDLSECAKKCSLKFDEMDIMEKLEYDSSRDFIEGFEDLGPLGRTQRRANKVFAVTLNSLDTFNPWRALILYVLPHNGLVAKDMVPLIQMCIDKATECDADVKMIVCDQGGPNRSAYAQLGVTAENPFFSYKNKRIIAIHDFPHAMKNLISAWQRYKVLVVDGKDVPFSDVVTTWKADRANKLSNTLGHLTQDHMTPNNFQRQNVRMSLQLVSNKLVAAMKAVVALKMGTPTMENSIWFQESMNDFTDVSNSSNVYDCNPMKKALSADNSRGIEVLKNFLNWGSTIRVWNKSKKNQNLISLPCFNALLMIAKGILELFEEMIAIDPSFKLCTRICCQDSLEQLFSRFRGRGGFNPNPTVRMLRLTIRHLIAVKNVASTSRGNTERDNGIYFPAVTPEELREQSQTEEVQEEVAAQRAMEFFETGKENLREDETEVFLESDQEDQEDEENQEDQEDQEDPEGQEDQENQVGEEGEDPTPFNAISGTLEGLSVAYFAGYTAFKTVEKFKCDRCLEDMQKPPVEQDEIDDQYIQYREYEGEFSYKIHLLARPTEKFRNIVTANLQTFVEQFDKKKHMLSGLRRVLIEDAKMEMLKVDPEWYSKGPCQDHRVFATYTLFTAKLHRHCTLENRVAKEEKLAKRRSKAAAKKSAPEKGKKRPANDDGDKQEPDDQKHTRKCRKLRIMKHQ